jgi:hypothetical protein
VAEIKKVASEWADRLVRISRMAHRPDQNLRGHFHDAAACLGAKCSLCLMERMQPRQGPPQPSLKARTPQEGGSSDGPPPPPRIRDFVDDLAAIFRQAGQGPALVVGVSFGEMVAPHLALRYPTLVSGMVLAASTGAPRGWRPWSAAPRTTPTR